MGYTPGEWPCVCIDCGDEFAGGERAAQCAPCAALELKAQMRALVASLAAANHLVLDRDSDKVARAFWRRLQPLLQQGLLDDVLAEKELPPKIPVAISTNMRTALCALDFPPRRGVVVHD